MFGKAVFNLIIAFSLIAAAGIARKGAKAQSNSADARDLTTEVFQVLDLPLIVHEALLVRAERGYFLKLSLANSSGLKIIGLRYSLVTINSENQVQVRVNRTEGFSLAAYGTRSVTFKTPIKFKQKDEARLVLMLEQVISRETIWEVVKAKEAFEAYARGDYSVMPVVLSVPNQVDAPPVTPRLIPRY